MNSHQKLKLSVEGGVISISDYETFLLPQTLLIIKIFFLKLSCWAVEVD